ncbi:hypothetical protein Btru_030099 [Bulinus truncatus]|nr:hypothetical protein Btru_030099 [Bulinus truncatus]
MTRLLLHLKKVAKGIPYYRNMSVKLKNENSEKYHKLTAYFSAVKAGNCRKVGKILKTKDVCINDTDPTDSTSPTAIIIACQLELLDMVELLLTAKPEPANVNAVSLTGCRAIWCAVKQGNIQLTKLLLSTKKCEVNYVDKETGFTPLYKAIILNNAEIVKELLKAGADVNAKLFFHSSMITPLIKAIQVNNIHICQLLINFLCNLHAKTEDGHTGLHFAVIYRCYDICELLLKSGINVNGKSKNGITAMTVAIEEHNPYMVRLLLQYGYKMDRPYSWHETPLEQAIRLHSNHSAMTLLSWGCKVTSKKKLSCFYLAVNEKLWDIVHFLVQLYPKFLQEKWLREERWPVAVYYDEALRNSLLELSKNVFRLKELCRSKVFRCIGKYAPVKIIQLPLPVSLINYLLFQEFIKDNFYTKVPLENFECPYDCPVMCPKWDCSPLDISVSTDSDECCDSNEMD